MNRDKKDEGSGSKGICRKCGRNEAKVHHVVVENNEVYEWHLCNECAVGEGFGVDDSDIGPARDEDLGNKKDNPICGDCGMSLADLRRTRRIGCAKCYEKFSDLLIRLLEKYHGSSYHIGRIPENLDDSGSSDSSPGVNLHKELEAAIATENYEKAAELRDRIRDIEEKSEDVE